MCHIKSNETDASFLVAQTIHKIALHFGALEYFRPVAISPSLPAFEPDSQFDTIDHLQILRLTAYLKSQMLRPVLRHRSDCIQIITTHGAAL